MTRKFYHAVSTLGFIGYSPYAPGTAGSLAGFLLLILFNPGDGMILLISGPLFLLGLLASHDTEKILGKDSGHIVIDELYGYLVSVLFIPKTMGYLIAALLLFRFFDILKPYPIRKIEESFSGGLGIMLDDLLAGFFANICLQLWIYFFV